MKKLLVAIFGFLIFISCNNGSKHKEISIFKPTPNVAQDKIVAVYKKRDGGKELASVLRQIQKTIRYDSLKGQDIVAVDTFWAILNDTIMKTSLGKDTTIAYWRQIGKDSINTHVENIPVDTLLKR